MLEYEQGTVNTETERVLNSTNMSQQEKIIRDLLDDVAKDNNYTNYDVTVKPISSGGANYSSYLYTATLSAPEKEDLNLFAKVAAIGEETREKAEIGGVFINEHYFYKNILKKYRHIEEYYNIQEEDKLVNAKFYAASSKYLYETLVLENLATRGFQSFNRLESIDWPYATCGIKNLAILNALSIAYSKEDPTGYANIIKSKLTLLPDDFLADSFPKAHEKALSVVKKENKDRLSKFFARPDIQKPLNKLYKWGPFVIHGDYRPSNMMHKVQSDGTVQVILLDYQTLREGCPVFDLLNFIFLGSDKHFRDQHLQESFDLYYLELSAALRRFNLDVRKIYNKETYQQDINELLPYMLSWCLYALLVITVDENEAPAVDEDVNTFGTNIIPNKLYVERMNDIVDDFIAMGFL